MPQTTTVPCVADTMQLDHAASRSQRVRGRRSGTERTDCRYARPAASAAYHQWLTPQQIGARFGLAREDLAVIRSWLESHGFSVNRVYSNRLVIDFSGSASQVRDSVAHGDSQSSFCRTVSITWRIFATRKSPARPCSMQSTASRLCMIFSPRRIPFALHVPHRAVIAPPTPWKPHFNIGISGTLFPTLAPYDFATAIYDLLPLWAPGRHRQGRDHRNRRGQQSVASRGLADIPQDLRSRQVHSGQLQADLSRLRQFPVRGVRTRPRNRVGCRMVQRCTRTVQYRALRLCEQRDHLGTR